MQFLKLVWVHYLFWFSFDDVFYKSLMNLVLNSNLALAITDVWSDGTDVRRGFRAEGGGKRFYYFHFEFVL